MAKITKPNPFEKGTKQYKMFQALVSGKPTPYADIVEAVNDVIANRTMGNFIRDIEKKGLRLHRTRTPEEGVVYTMLEGDAAKGVKKLGVVPGSYKEKAANATKRTAKKASAPIKKAAAKSTAPATKAAPVKKATAKPVKAAAKAAPSKQPKKRPVRGSGEEVAVETATKNTPKKATKLGLKIKPKA